MPVTFRKKVPRVIGLNSYLSYLKRHEAEGATQTYNEGSPVILSAGYIIEHGVGGAADVTAVHGIALGPGSNTASAGLAKAEFALADPKLEFFITLLQAAGANRTLLATDKGLKCAMTHYPAGLPDGQDFWAGDAADTTTKAIEIISFRSDIVPPNQVVAESAAGDINARVVARFLNSVLSNAS